MNNTSRYLILFLLISISTLQSNASQLDSILTELDYAISQREVYAQSRMSKITELENQLDESKDYAVRQRFYTKIYKLYRSYDMDKALEVGYLKLNAAELKKDSTGILQSKMEIAEVLGRMGLYKEAFDILDNLAIDTIPQGLYSYYYHVYHATYSLLFENALSKREKSYYGDRMSIYKNDLLRIMDNTSAGYHLVYSSKLLDERNYEAALNVIYPIFKVHENNEPLLGTLGYGVGIVYEQMGDLSAAKYYYAISAKADLKLGVRGYIALRRLAILLFNDGDVERAYSYIKCAMEDAILCKAKYRILEVSESLPIIASAYNRKISQDQQRLSATLVVVSILSVLLLISFIFIYKQFNKLRVVKDQLKLMYSKEKSQNEDLEKLNGQLVESNLIKEQYIASVFNLCSDYIHKMDNSRIDLNRKLTTGLVAEAMQVTGNSKFLNQEMKNFYEKFDAIFLSIYPNFVQEFNELLLDEEKIVPKNSNTLTSELRVFALVRLGISDSGKIAEFLNYSPQTVYNYNQRIKKKIAVDKDVFDEAITRIGR